MRTIQTELAVIGGGPAGVCAALSAARLGVKTLLVGNRPVLGGNSSSEIRVWTRGATGAGNLFAEEMGIWGLLKMQNLYKNPDANPIFWDEILLDTVLSEKNITLYLNTEITDVELNGGHLAAVTGFQQSSEIKLRIEAKYYIDATGDGSIGAKSLVPYYMGKHRVEYESGEHLSEPELLGSSILYYSKKEDHPIRFVPPEYAYNMTEIEQIINQGGRVANETITGSDCWWFEYGGICDTIQNAQDITLELKRLVFGVWNYIKNSGHFDADCYTLEWIGNIPGKRESRRMETEYLLTANDILQQKEFSDGAFYGGWYMDFHPVGGMLDSGEENCIQIPVNVYQIPLRCLYSKKVSNLLFAGRNIGTEREAFVSSRIMNTCALSGQAAATLAVECIRSSMPPSQLTKAQIGAVQQTLLKEDMFIPGLRAQDTTDLVQQAQITSSSTHNGQAEKSDKLLSLQNGGFLVFPGVGEKQVKFHTYSEKEVSIKATLYSSMLPSRLRLGNEVNELHWSMTGGDYTCEFMIPSSCDQKFCILSFPPTDGLSLYLSANDRTGFICGHEDESNYRAPMVYYSPKADVNLYSVEQVRNGYSRPWGGVNQWCAAPDDTAPWLQLDWTNPVEVKRLHLYLDPDLSMEIPSSRAKSWQASHIYTPRMNMPAQLVRTFRIQAPDQHMSWQTVYQVQDNYQRLSEIVLAESIVTSSLRILFEETWGHQCPAVFELRAYSD